jgi:aspartyl-tRNA(Asn)/glutamyl-tRNA(Gln) amidotransferase subunit A
MSKEPLLISEIQTDIQAGRLTAEASVSASLDRIGALNGKLKAFVKVDLERALADARHLDHLAKLGVPKGPLFGVPLAIKDIIDVEGLRTGGGSLTRKDAIPAGADAEVVSRLRQAGAVVVGKVATVEYAFGGWGSNETVGAPHNPWDLEKARVPGGSSSGSGVAVAAGLVPGALGSDTGGSIRLPSSFTGLVGLKTTAGLIPKTGVLPLSDMLDTIGPMTRTVQDAAILFDVLLGNEAGTSAPGEVDLSAPFYGLRVGVPVETGVILHPDTAKAYANMQDRLKAGGATLVPVQFPMSLADYAAPCGMFLAVDSYRHYGHFAEEEPNRLGAPVRARMLSGKGVSAVDYANNLERREREKQVIAQRFELIDAILMPATTMPAAVLGEHPEHDSPAVFTRFANYFDLAAISLPTDISVAGLPIAMQFVVPGFKEARALDIAHRAEVAQGGPILCPILGHSTI